MNNPLVPTLCISAVFMKKGHPTSSLFSTMDLDYTWCGLIWGNWELGLLAYIFQKSWLIWITRSKNIFMFARKFEWCVWFKIHLLIKLSVQVQTLTIQTKCSSSRFWINYITLCTYECILKPSKSWRRIWFKRAFEDQKAREKKLQAENSDVSELRSNLMFHLYFSFLLVHSCLTYDYF